MRRRKSRESSLQFLYMLENNPSMQELDPEELIHIFHDHFSVNSSQDQEYFRQISFGCLEEREYLDTLISEHCSNWKVSRINKIDLNILRIAIYELTRVNHVDAAVVMDEAIEIAKKFGNQDSSAFVNGVLDKIYTLQRTKKL